MSKNVFDQKVAIVVNVIMLPAVFLIVQNVTLYITLSIVLAIMLVYSLIKKSRYLLINCLIWFLVILTPLSLSIPILKSTIFKCEGWGCLALGPMILGSMFLMLLTALIVNIILLIRRKRMLGL